MQSANTGQTARPYPPAGSSAWGASISQVRPALSNRSMIVGTHCTGEVRYGPEPSGLGTQAGSSTGDPPPGGCQGTSLLPSQPQPGPGLPPIAAGLSPVKSSRLAEARVRCEPQVGIGPSSKVR